LKCFVLKILDIHYSPLVKSSVASLSPLQRQSWVLGLHARDSLAEFGEKLPERADEKLPERPAEKFLVDKPRAEAEREIDAKRQF
jgi:hypothetical protein